MKVRVISAAHFDSNRGESKELLKFFTALAGSATPFKIKQSRQSIMLEARGLEPRGLRFPLQNHLERSEKFKDKIKGSDHE